MGIANRFLALIDNGSSLSIIDGVGNLLSQCLNIDVYFR